MTISLKEIEWYKKKEYIPFIITSIILIISSAFVVNDKLYFILCDDEMISMYYSKTNLSGIEGYTNLGWVLVMMCFKWLPPNLASLPIILVNLLCIFGIMRYSRNPLLIGLTFPLLFWAVRGVEFIPIAFLFFYALKTKKLIIPVILITLLRADGFVYSGILLLTNYIKQNGKTIQRN